MKKIQYKIKKIYGNVKNKIWKNYFGKRGKANINFKIWKRKNFYE